MLRSLLMKCSPNVVAGVILQIVATATCLGLAAEEPVAASIRSGVTSFILINFIAGSYYVLPALRHRLLAIVITMASIELLVKKQDLIAAITYLLLIFFCQLARRRSGSN
jgi:hypothetical protein